MKRQFADFCGECLNSIRRTFPSHLPLYVCAVVFSAMTAAMALACRTPLSFTASLVFLKTVPTFFALFVALAAIGHFVRLVRSGSRHPAQDFWIWMYGGFLADNRPGNAFHTLLTLTPLMISFSALKEAIPLIHPFSWDETLMLWDRAIGLGYMPWEWLQPVLGYPVITAGINLAYDFWFIAMFGTLIWQAFFARSGALRMQFLIAFAFAWFIAGNVLAVVFSSAGPCFYGHFQANDPYAPLMAYLRAANEHWPIWSVTMQDLLWESYEKTKGLNLGISAMPSMHVVMAVLMALLARRVARWLGIAFTIYAAIIVIGSIHLGWHYATDAIAGAALAFLFWKVAGAIVRAGAFKQPQAAAAPV